MLDGWVSLDAILATDGLMDGAVDFTDDGSLGVLLRVRWLRLGTETKNDVDVDTSVTSP